MIEILRLSLPMTLWVTGFSAIYALQGFACSRHWPDDLWVRPGLLGAWTVAVALQVVILLAVHFVPSQSRFVQTVAATLALTALVAALWTLMPAVLNVSACL